MRNIIVVIKRIHVSLKKSMSSSPAGINDGVVPGANRP